MLRRWQQRNAQQTRGFGAFPANAPGMTSNSDIAGTKHHRILVVDDNRDGADALVSLLSVLGFRATAVYSGAEALRFAREFAPRLIFLDLDMPLMTGFKTLDHLKSASPSLSAHVVALTARGGSDVREQCMRAGFDRFICKPVDSDVFVDLATIATLNS